MGADDIERRKESQKKGLIKNMTDLMDLFCLWNAKKISGDEAMLKLINSLKKDKWERTWNLWLFRQEHPELFLTDLEEIERKFIIEVADDGE